MNVNENIQRLKGCQWLEIQSARLLGGWLPGIPKWEIKGMIALHLWQDAQRSQQIRTRLWELRTPFPDRKLPGNPAAIIAALSRAQHDYEFLAGLYLGLKRTLISEYKDLLAQTNGVCDAPTLPLLTLAISGLENQVQWAQPVIAELADTGERQRQVARWRTYIENVLDRQGFFETIENSPAAGGSIVEPPPGYSDSPLPFANAKRDSRFRLCLEGPAPPTGDDSLGRTLFQFANYAHEMQAAETLGSVLWEADEMDWEFYFDVARHCYDEARHSQLGETRLRELGHHISDFPHTVANYAWRQLIDPMRRYCVLTYVIEADSFEYKHKTYNRYLEIGDTLSAESVLFDIIDETMHVRWGKKWTPKLIERYGYDKPLEDLIRECRTLLVENTVSPLQRDSAQQAACRVQASSAPEGTETYAGR